MSSMSQAGAMATPSTKIDRARAAAPEAPDFTAAQAVALVARTTSVDAVGLEERAA